MITHQIYNSFSDAKPYVEAWDELSKKYGDIYSSPDWCEVWWKYYGKNRTLQLHFFFNENELVGVLPLFREILFPFSLRIKSVRLLGCDHGATPAGLAVNFRYLSDVICLLAERMNETWDVIHFGPVQNMNTSKINHNAILQNRNIGQFWVCIYDACISMVDLPKTFDRYLELIPQPVKKDTQRCSRKLDADHHVVYRSPDSSTEALASMSHLIRLHQFLWTNKGKQGQFEDWPYYREFHTELAEKFYQTGKLANLQMISSDTTINATYGYYYGSTFYDLVRGNLSDKEWMPYSLGRVMYFENIKRAIEHGMTKLDSGRGYFDHKLKLGGRLVCEKSLWLLHRGSTVRFRFWMAMMASYFIHVLYGRIWFDVIRRKTGLPSRPLWKKFIITQHLSRLFKSGCFSLFTKSASENQTCRYGYCHKEKDKQAAIGLPVHSQPSVRSSLQHE
jgi:CelD/BcsL family acetyltransferase involved in cellulose biosynthesis